MGKGASCVWNKLIKVKDEVEHEIWWQIKSGPVNFWLDNWTKLGALYFLEKQECECELEVREFMVDGSWNKTKLNEVLSEEMVEQIITNIKPLVQVNEADCP